MSSRHPRASTWCSLRSLGPVRRCAIIARGGGYCAWCGAALTQSTCQIDHVVPRRRGGGDGNDNLVPACIDCNQGRPDVPGDLAQLREPVDLWLGLQVALAWYPWLPDRLRDAARRWDVSAARRAEANRAAVEAGLDGDAFPFGQTA